MSSLHPSAELFRAVGRKLVRSRRKRYNAETVSEFPHELKNQARSAQMNHKEDDFHDQKE
jgi:hypothetical protein